MRRPAVIALSVVALLASLPPTHAAEPAAFAIANFRVFDGAQVLPRATVVVRNGRIDAVWADFKALPGIQILDGRGKTLLPGLIDSHVHTFGTARRDAVRFGVTAELDMFTDWHALADFQRDRDGGSVATQSDVYSAGTLVTVAGGHGTEYGMTIPTLETSDNAAAFVDARIAEGSDFIKIIMEDGTAYGRKVPGPTLSNDSVRATIIAARARSKLSVVHVALARDGAFAIDAGANGLAHVFQDAPASDEFVALAKQRGAFVIPTLTVIDAISRTQSAAQLAADPRVAPNLTELQRRSLGTSFPARADDRRFAANAKASVRKLHAAGVPILAGTDAGNPGTTHGASLHGELQLLVDAGLSPVDALAAATSVPAKLFNLRERGRIERGMRADLVLVEGDPTTDITATRAIVTIWKNGTPVDRSTAPPKAPAASTQTLLSRFDGAKPDVNYGFGWQSTTDALAGGKSAAQIAVVTGGAKGSAGALEVDGEIKTGAAYTWSGAIYFAGSNPAQTVDYTAKRTLVFHTKGDDRTYQAMIFTGENPMPIVQSFKAGADWQEYQLALSDFKGADLGHVRAFALVAVNPVGKFRLLIDEVEVR